ncbi:hypothetical protein [Paraflavitalea speifideaquila]|uniref:hypothetical protein n=1 Tax=Paraflavitalea speifideaquila TaxID=3076558 RepID=UPI0028E672CE|nr:hypothetical protein [Paraflavitalea speifideiaquila]
MEITLNASIIRKKDLSWDFGIIASFLKNEVRDLSTPIPTGALHGQGISGATVQLIANNQPINVFYLKKYLGINKATGIADYEQEGYERYYVGNPNPKTVIGITSSVQYKNCLQ